MRICVSHFLHICDSATFAGLLDLHQLLPHVPKIGSPSFQRFLLTLIPRPEMRKMIWIVETIWDTSKEIFIAKRSALEKGEDETMHQVGERKDLMSILCTFYRS